MGADGVNPAGVAGPVVLVGPTASGKSAVAMEVARRAKAAGQRPVEIIAADAMQVYQGLDIGTAKPTAEDRRLVRHWCIDIADPAFRFTVSDYTKCFEIAMTSLTEAGARPLVVGGTGLYVSAVVDRFEMPGEWPELRSRFETILDQSRLRKMLAETDPLSAERIPPNNRRRLIRALEVSVGSGRPFSSFGPGVSVPRATDFRLYGLRWDRDVLRRRIAERVHAMLDEGLVEEVRRLAPMLQEAPTAGQAIGYKELLGHVVDGTPLATAVGDIILRTQQLAVAQEKWFRRDPRITWIDVTRDPVAEATETILSALP